MTTLDQDYDDRPVGPVSAAIIAGGIGCLVMGILTTVAEASESFADKLALRDSVGPLSGKTTFTVAAWLVAWAVLHMVMRNSRYESRKALTVCLVLIALGVLGTFPTFFQVFAPD